MKNANIWSCLPRTETCNSSQCLLLLLFSRNTIKLLLNLLLTISRTIKWEQWTSAGSTAWNALFIYSLKGIHKSLCSCSPLISACCLDSSLKQQSDRRESLREVLPGLPRTWEALKAGSGVLAYGTPWEMSARDSAWWEMKLPRHAKQSVTLTQKATERTLEKSSNLRTTWVLEAP